ncbi:caffeine-induced death protein 2 [Podospora conica]|nr:caffeine-induced death protein 2 [Schizothecium conicum]
MARPLASPALSPQFCFSSTALRDFLRLSRSSVDDTLNQHLNALITPAREGFDPASTSQLRPRQLSRQVDSAQCTQFKETVLFPAWHDRSRVLSYCTLVATSPDPDDPEAALLKAEDEKSRQRTIDERLDPYSARYFPREPRTQQLASLIRQEQSVENIVRSKTWATINERCGVSGGSWEQAFEAWRRRGSSLPTSNMK